MAGRFVVVKNWQRFQHQSERRLPWIKFFTSLLEPTRDLAYAALPDVSKALLHHIWLMARVFNNRIPEDWLTRERLNLQSRVNLDPLLESGFISYETEDTSLTCARRASQSSLVSVSEEEGESEGKPPHDPWFEAAWNEYPRKRGREKARGHFIAQVKTRADIAAMESAIRNYRREIEILQTEERFVMIGPTFFGGRWRDFVDGVWREPAQRTNAPGTLTIRQAPRKVE